MSDDEEEIVEPADYSHVDTDEWRAAIAKTDPIKVPDVVWLALSPAPLVASIFTFGSEEAAVGFVGRRQHMVVSGPYKFMGQKGLFG